MSRVRVLVRCVRCRKTRWIEPGEIAPDDVPWCDTCFMPMVAVKAERKET